MTHHPLHPIDIKIRKAKHRIADDDTFERYGSRIEDAEGQVRDIFACVGLARDEEGVVGVLWEFWVEVFEREEVVACGVDVVVDVVGVVVYAEPHACRAIYEQQIRNIRPRVSIKSQQIF